MAGINEETAELYGKKKTSNCRKIAVCSLKTSMHITFPIVKVLSRLGSTNVITEDKLYISIDPVSSEDFTLGNARIRVVDCVSAMDEGEWALENYDFTVFDIRQFLPTCEMDKYVLLSNRHYFRSQIADMNFKSTPIFSVCDCEFLKPKDRKAEMENRFVNEKYIKFGNYLKYDKFLNNLSITGTKKCITPSEMISLTCELLNGLSDITKSNIITYLREDNFI
jgi:hypothetical protein